ncbi:UNVERIFIED_CONTAM: hypothetical protein PYX00_002273 [Menopon gallinae]|uniref:NADH dehydrogenase [ubiquinone] 1 alpha subcomplex assembly factor 5 n=1 Tax=Menopon gallinae TaxID=328185 RepID=A0AAW2IGP0_9NEOP
MNFSSVLSKPRGLTILFNSQHKNIPKSVINSHERTIFVSTTKEQIKPETQPKLNIFDRKAKIIQRERAALSEDAEYHSYLKDEIGFRLADRIFDIKRTFPKVLDLGCGRGHVSKHVVSDSVEELIMCDNSEILVSQATCGDSAVKTSKVVCDEENLLSVFKPDTFNMVISNLVLHWVNDLPKCFSQVMSILKNDGAFLGSIFGSDTLFELRSALQLAESERKGGISPHISPFARPRDVGSLLTQAGFVMQTIDTDEVVLRYRSMFDLLQELRGMGESNSSWNRCLHLSRDTLLAASAIYEEEKNMKAVNATFQIIYFIGWKPDPSQPQPLQRGSADMSLKDLYNLNDIVVKEGKFIKPDEDK